MSDNATKTQAVSPETLPAALSPTLEVTPSVDPEPTSYYAPAAKTDPVSEKPLAQEPMKYGKEERKKVIPLQAMVEKGYIEQWVKCQHCDEITRPKVVTKGEGAQCVVGALLCLICICAAPLPCCLHWFEETHWYCQSCKAQIAHKVPECPIQIIPPTPKQRQQTEAAAAAVAEATPTVPPPVAIIPPTPATELQSNRDEQTGYFAGTTFSAESSQQVSGLTDPTTPPQTVSVELPAEPVLDSGPPKDTKTDEESSPKPKETTSEVAK